MNILFFGELYPNVLHGVSIANRLNLDMLNDTPSVDVAVIQEQTQVSSIGKSSFSKISTLFFSILSVRKQSRKVPYQVFYSVISLSLLGMLKTVFTVYAFAKNNNAQIVLHLHRGDFVRFYQANLLHRFLIKLCFRRVDRLIVLSENQKIEMSKFFDSKAIFVVENAVLEEKQLPKYDIKSSFGKRFVYISNYIEAKGIYDLLEAVKTLPDISLNCYGAFTDNEQQLKAYETNNVLVNPPINGVEKFAAIHLADTLILPSWNEGQPTIILEAMLVGTPVLTTKVGLIGELLGEDYPFYFSPQNPEDLAACVKRFVAYEDKVALSCQLQARYFQYFSQAHHKIKLYNAFGITNN